MQVGVVEVEFDPGVGEERREQVGHLVVGEDDGDRPLDVAPSRVTERPRRAGGIGDVGVAQQDERVESLVGHRRPEAGAAFATHPGEVRLRRQVERVDAQCEGGTHQSSRPRNVITLVLTIFTAASGPTAATTLASDCSEYPNVLSLCG